MPFVRSLPLMLQHQQRDDDPVRAAAEVVDPIISARLFAAWNDLASQVRDSYTPQRLTDGDTLQRIARSLSEEVRPIAHDLLLARSLGHRAMTSQIVDERVQKDFSVGFQFDRLAPAVQDQADQYAARLVREIGEDTRSTLSGMIRQGVAAGRGPEELARTMRDSVGLTIRQANAVQNYRRLLETGAPEAQTRALRDQRFDVSETRLAFLTPEQIDTRVDAYRRRYVAHRANTIARYETLSASNGGSLSAMQSAIKTGLLPASTVKTWMIAKDELTCPRCRSIPRLQPDGVGVDEAFVWEAGKHSGEVYVAPLHPLCRCSVSYRVR